MLVSAWGVREAMLDPDEGTKEVDKFESDVEARLDEVDAKVDVMILLVLSKLV